MNTLAILITSHNRAAKTIQCLDNVFAQKITWHIDVYLVIDGSTDETEIIVRNRYPQVKIVNGTGLLYWNGGMLLAWKTALSVGGYNAYLWLNDDTFLFMDSLEKALSFFSNNHILVGPTQSTNDFEWTYGGYRQNQPLLLGNADMLVCDYFNGNFVLIPHFVYEKVGLLDSNFRHALGDFDYGLRAKKLGIVSMQLPFFVGNCETHDQLPNWRNPRIALTRRFKALYHPLSGCNPFEFFHFDLRHKGILMALVHFFSIHLRAIAPHLWKTK